MIIGGLSTTEKPPPSVVPTVTCRRHLGSEEPMYLTHNFPWWGRASHRDPEGAAPLYLEGGPATSDIARAKTLGHPCTHTQVSQKSAKLAQIAAKTFLFRDQSKHHLSSNREALSPTGCGPQTNKVLPLLLLSSQAKSPMPMLVQARLLPPSFFASSSHAHPLQAHTALTPPPPPL